MFRMTASAMKTTFKIVLVVVFLVSATLNVATFSVGALSTAISSVVEAAIGVKTVAARYATKEAEVVKLVAANKGMKAGQVALKAELAELRVGKKALGDAVSATTRRVSTRTVKLATADLSATVGQAIPWIGIAVVVAATAYDLDMSCETMKDMKALDLAMNPSADEGADVDTVCGMVVPTKEEVWEAVKASPGAAWDAAASVLTGLPDMMPSMPEVDWTPWN